MNKINKKISLIFIILLCFIIGGTLSFESLARFTKKFETVSKKVSLATFEVKADSNFEKDVVIKPGDILSEDTIKLTNNNDYPVEFTISLSKNSQSTNEESTISEDAKDLIDYLSLTINGISQTQSQNQYKTIIGAKDERVVSAKIEWSIDDETEIYDTDIKSNIAEYTYDIKAKQINSVLLYENYFNSSEVINEWTLPMENNDYISFDEDSKAVKLSGAAYTSLNDLNFDLNYGMVTVKSEIEIIRGENNELENGFNISYNFGDKYSSTDNNFTYQFYKKSNEDYVSLNLSNDALLSLPNKISNYDNVINDNFNYILVGDFEVVNGSVVATLKVNDLNNNTIYKEEFNGNIYDSDSKFFINVSSLCTINGLKIKSIEVKQTDLK